MSTLTAFWAWLSGSRIGRATGAVLGILVAGVLIYTRGRSAGKTEGREEVRRRAIVGAEAREAKRDEIDNDVRTDERSAADRLRDEWSRD